MSIRRWLVRVALVSCILPVGCAGASSAGVASAGVASSETKAHAETSYSALNQVGTLDQLIRGRFDGTLPVGNVGQIGDFGLGTFNALDGELTMLDGVVYQFTSDGILHVADRKTLIPFIAVSRFHSAQHVEITTAISGYPALQAFITNSVPDQTRMFAIKVHGTFSSLKTRAPRRQTPPYVPLAEATKTQVEFTHTNIQGTMVGFRLPAYLGTTNATGYHFHFVSDDHQKGGHVLDISTDSATVDVQTLDRLQLAVLQE